MTNPLNPEAAVAVTRDTTPSTTCHCGRPTHGTTLCTGQNSCTAQLIDDLVTLHRGHHLRTRTHVVEYHHGAEPVTTTVDDYAPGLLADLDDAITRQTRTGLSTRSILAPAEEQLLFNEAASAEMAEARRVLTHWAAQLVHIGIPLSLPGRGGQRLTAPLAAEWLADHSAQLATLVNAAQAAADIAGVVRRTRKLVDRAPDLTYVGPCDRDLVDPTTRTRVACGRDLYGHLDRPTVRCPGCGLVYELSQRRDWLLLKVGEQLATTEEITRALPTLLGEDVASSTIRAWAHQGRLTQYGPHPADRRKRPRYRVRDVLNLAAEAIRTKRERALRRLQQGSTSPRETA